MIDFVKEVKHELVMDDQLYWFYMLKCEGGFQLQEYSKWGVVQYFIVLSIKKSCPIKVL